MLSVKNIINEFKIDKYVTALMMLLILNISYSQHQHADYVVLGKSINTRQLSDGKLEFLNTVFFSEIFTTSDGLVTNGSLKGPGEAKDGLIFPQGKIQFLTGERQFSLDELNNNFPDSTYYFDFDTPDGEIRGLPATFKRDGNEIKNPGPIKITLYQDGKVVEPSLINPDLDLIVSWTPFLKGSPDSLDIAQDMIYVIMGDCFGNETVHSGHAISNPDALTFESSNFVIDEMNFFPGQSFQLEVEHSNMDTDIQFNIEVIVTYAATTFLDIKTIGDRNQEVACPDIPYRMDGGQTDRQVLSLTKNL